VAIADAVFAHSRGDGFLAMQRISPKPPFKRVNRAGSQTDLSLRGARTHMLRDFPDIDV